MTYMYNKNDDRKHAYANVREFEFRNILQIDENVFHSDLTVVIWSYLSQHVSLFQSFY